jgi:hypothetical protein
VWTSHANTEHVSKAVRDRKQLGGNTAPASVFAISGDQIPNWLVSVDAEEAVNATAWQAKPGVVQDRKPHRVVQESSIVGQEQDLVVSGKLGIQFDLELRDFPFSHGIK